MDDQNRNDDGRVQALQVAAAYFAENFEAVE